MTKRWKALLVDDDPLIIQSFELIMPEGWALSACKGANEIPNETFHAAFVDMHLSGNNSIAEGLEVIEKLAKKNPHLEIVAISGDINRTLMEQCLKVGATRFLAKPFNETEIRLVLDKIEALYLLHLASNRNYQRKYCIGKSDKSSLIKKQIAQLRGEPGPILIEGESGTGKEITVQMIRDQDSDRPFVAINISAIPESLFESELFGHVKGAFTGADQNKMGLAEAAHGGDLFIDEIEALTLPCQVKLLRFLETNEIRRVGSKQSSNIAVRVLAATNQNLEKLVQEGKFREDLLWRLNGKKIVLPPLRERPDDISELAKFFLEQQSPRYNKTFSEDAIEVLKKHSWPGNIRELRRIVEQACLNSPLPIIRAEDVEGLFKTRLPLLKVATAELDFARGLDVIMGEYERCILVDCLKKYSDIDKASEILGISRSGLYKKIKDYNIDV